MNFGDRQPRVTFRDLRAARAMWRISADCGLSEDRVASILAELQRLQLRYLVQDDPAWASVRASASRNSGVRSAAVMAEEDHSRQWGDGVPTQRGLEDRGRGTVGCAAGRSCDADGVVR